MVFLYPAEKELKAFYGYLRVFIGINCRIALFIQAGFVTFRSVMNQRSDESAEMLKEFFKAICCLNRRQQERRKAFLLSLLLECHCCHTFVFSFLPFLISIFGKKEILFQVFVVKAHFISGAVQVDRTDISVSWE